MPIGDFWQRVPEAAASRGTPMNRLFKRTYTLLTPTPHCPFDSLCIKKLLAYLSLASSYLGVVDMVWGEDGRCCASFTSLPAHRLAALPILKLRLYFTNK